METKICKECKENKPLLSFHKHKNSKDKLSYKCKDCWNAKCKEFRLNNPDKIKLTNKISYYNKRQERLESQKEYSLKNKEKLLMYAKEYREKNPFYSRKQSLKRFGLELEDFFKMIEKQSNSCTICGNEFKKDSDAHLDHNHRTNKHRGLLCSACNTSIGLVKENTITLNNMIKYLELWKENQ